MDQSPAPKPRHGCFFYGCIAGTVCLVAILVAALLGLHMFKKALNQFTDTRPAPLPTVQLSPAEIQAVQRRVDLFQDAVSAGRPTPPLALDSDEINALLSSRPDTAVARDKVFLHIDGQQLRAQVSLPMDQIGLKMFRGRYLNGEALLAISLDNGLLRIAATNVTVKGKPLPDVYLDKLRRENLAHGINENSKASIALNRLEKIEVQDGKIILTPKQER